MTESIAGYFPISHGHDFQILFICFGYFLRPVASSFFPHLPSFLKFFEGHTEHHAKICQVFNQTYFMPVSLIYLCRFTLRDVLL